MEFYPRKSKQAMDYKNPNKNDKFINLERTKILIAAHPECKQLIRLPDNTRITDKTFDQVIDIFEEEVGDSLQYFICPNLSVENMQINIDIKPIVESA